MPTPLRPFHPVPPVASDALKRQCRPWIVQLYDSTVQLRAQSGNQVVPRRWLAREKSNPEYRLLEKARSQDKNGQLSSAEFMLLVQLDVVLAVVGQTEQTDDLSWRSTFPHADFAVHAYGFATDAAAKAELIVARHL